MLVNGDSGPGREDCDRARYPHDQAGKLLILEGREPKCARCAGMHRIPRRMRHRDCGAEQGALHTRREEVERGATNTQLPALQCDIPEEKRTHNEERMLEHVREGIFYCRVIELRRMPRPQQCHVNDPGHERHCDDMPQCGQSARTLPRNPRTGVY